MPLSHDDGPTRLLGWPAALCWHRRRAREVSSIAAIPAFAAPLMVQQSLNSVRHGDRYVGLIAAVPDQRPPVDALASARNQA